MKREITRVRYAIKINGKYALEIYEPTCEGLFTFVKDIENATTYHSAESARKTVEDEMNLNIHNVSIHRVTYHAPLITPLVLCDGVFVDLSTVEQCKTCNKWFPMNEIHKFRIDLDSEIESYCEEHYEEMNSKYPNCFHGNQDSDVSEVLK